MTDMRASSSYFSEPPRRIPEMPIIQELPVGGDADSLSSFPSEHGIDNTPGPIVPVPKRHPAYDELPQQVHAGDARINHFLDRLAHVEQECMRVAEAVRDLETRVETGPVTRPSADTHRDFVWLFTQWTTVNTKARAAAEGVRTARLRSGTTIGSVRRATIGLRRIVVVQGVGIIASYRRLIFLCAVLPAVIVAGAALVRPAANIDARSAVAPDPRPNPHDARLVDILLPVDPPGISESPPPVVKTTKAKILSSAPAGRRDRSPAENRGLAFVGTLVIDSVPRGAVVMVDYREVGVTPMRLSNLNAGRYAVWLVRDGYSRWTDAVVVPASKVTHVSARLERSSERSTP